MLGVEPRAQLREAALDAFVGGGDRDALDLGQVRQRAALEEAQDQRPAQRLLEPEHEVVEMVLDGIELVEVAERLLHELGEILALLGRHRLEHAVHRGGLAREVVEQLLDRLGVVREELAVLVHELGEVGVGVLAGCLSLSLLLARPGKFGQRLPSPSSFTSSCSPATSSSPFTPRPRRSGE